MFQSVYLRESVTQGRFPSTYIHLSRTALLYLSPSSKHTPTALTAWRKHTLQEILTTILNRCKVCKTVGHIPGEELFEFHVESENIVIPSIRRNNCLSNF